MPPLKKKEKRMLIAIGILIAAFIVMDPYYLWKTPPEKPGSSKQKKADTGKKDAGEKEAKPVGKAARKMTAETVKIPRERIPLEGWKRDPFVQARPDLDEADMISQMRLGAITVRGNNRMALINSKVVRVGDMILGMEVGSIETDRVVLKTGNRSYTLTWER